MGVPEGKKKDKRATKITRNLTRNTKKSYQASLDSNSNWCKDCRKSNYTVTKKDSVTTYFFSFVTFIDF